MTGVAVLQYGNLRIDPNERRVNILYCLALHPGWTFTREQLYRYAMSDDFASGPESVTSRIYKIRKKLNINAIQTVHGYGYRFEK